MDFINTPNYGLCIMNNINTQIRKLAEETYKQLLSFEHEHNIGVIEDAMNKLVEDIKQVTEGRLK